MIEPTHANGYRFGRPEGRDVTELDGVIQGVIESLPPATRLYPDVYSWMITDAVIRAQPGETNLEQVMDALPHFSGVFLSRVIKRAENIIQGRIEDGVFE